MAEQKQDGRPKKGGDKKQENQPHGVRMSEAAKAAAVRKHRQNVECHLAQEAKRSKRANRPGRTPKGWKRRIHRAAEMHQLVVPKVVEQPADAGYAPTPFGHALARMDREAEQAGLFPERE